MKRFFYFLYGRPLYQLCMGILVFAAMWVFVKRFFKKTQWLLLNRMLTAACLCTVLYYTLLMRSPTEEIRLQLIPFYNLSHSTYKMGILQSMWLNVTLFVPLGVFIGNGITEHVNNKFIKCAGICLCISLCIECTQWIARLGLAETDDVILNTLGGMIGYGVSMLFDFLLDRIEQKRRME